MLFPARVLEVLTDPRTVIRDDAVQVPFELDRATYTEMDKVLKDMGGKWDGRKAVRAHVFPYRIEEYMRQCLTAGEYASRQEQGWFPTPPRLATHIIDAAGVYAGDTVLEPSAGAGALTSEAASRGGVVDAVEVDARRAGVLREQGDCRRVVHGDFLAMDPFGYEEGFDRVVMNPPFANGLDHITHALGFMHHGGVLVSVMSQGLMFWSDRRSVSFRELVWEVGGDIEQLPDDEFAVCGRSVRTCLVFIPGYPGSRLPTRDWLLAQPTQLDLFGAA